MRQIKADNTNVKDFTMLRKYRRDDLEKLVFAERKGLPGNIAGDIVLGGRSIRFSIEQSDDRPFFSLSAEGPSRCSRSDIHRFTAFAKISAMREVQARTEGTVVRTFRF